MHEFKGEYKENNCCVKIESDNPYLLLNLETYCNCNGLTGVSHCDFVYVFLKGREFHIFIVELKDVGDLTKNDMKSILDDVVDNKFPQTLNNIIPNILKFSNINVGNTQCYGVLVLPLDLLNKVNAIFSHLNSKLVALKKRGFAGSWVAQCGENIWNRLF